MGHSEMLLAVAGQKPDEIKERTKKLSAGDWSGYAPAERLAMQFGHKLTRTPWAVSTGDTQALVKAFGKDRAMDVIWRVCWCNYMIRVADAFQLPLEKDNVFMPPKKAEKKDEKKESGR
jgi:hypothetical protein